MLTVIWKKIGPITLYFLEKGAIVTIASYCQFVEHYSLYLFTDLRI